MTSSPPLLECSICGFDAVGRCAACGQPFCWSHGDGLPPGTAGRLHATCAHLARSEEANEVRSLARAVAEAGFVSGRADLADRIRPVWEPTGDEAEADPRLRFDLLAEVIVVAPQGAGSAPGLGVDAEGHLWDLDAAAEAVVADVRPWTARLRGGGASRPLPIGPPRPGPVGRRRPAQEPAPPPADRREVRLLRAAVSGEPLALIPY